MASTFSMDALSSAVAMKVNCDLQLTLMACRGTELGKEYTNASRRIFRDFIDASNDRFLDHHRQFAEGRKRTRVPWLGGRHLQIFG